MKIFLLLFLSIYSKVLTTTNQTKSERKLFGPDFMASILGDIAFS